MTGSSGNRTRASWRRWLAEREGKFFLGLRRTAIRWGGGPQGLSLQIAAADTAARKLQQQQKHPQIKKERRRETGNREAASQRSKRDKQPHRGDREKK